MKILISSEQYPPESVGGVPTAVYNLVHFLADRGNEVVVLTTGRRSTRETEEKITVYRLANIHIPMYPNAPIVASVGEKVKEIFDKEKPDILHVELLLGLGIASLREAKKRGIPVVFSLHALPENANQLFPSVWPISRGVEWLFWKWTGYFVKRADCVTAPSSYALKLLTSRFDINCARKISNGLDLVKFKRDNDRMGSREKLDIKSKNIVLYVGRLQHEKSPQVLLQAALLVLNKNPDTLFILVGTGPMLSKLQKLAIDLGIEDRVLFSGFVEEKELKKYYEAASVFVMPSAQELQGIAVMEAMAYSLPVIVCQAKALPELVDESKNGFLFKEGNSRDLAQKLNKMFEIKYSDTLGRHSYEKIKLHDIRKTAQEYEGLYKKLIKTKNTESMTVSVVVPAYNEEKYLQACLGSLMDQEVKPTEIILVDNNSTDKTVEIAQNFPVKIIMERKQGIIPARNAGFDFATSNIIARCDADTVLPRDWVKRIKADFKNYDIVALSGKVNFYDLAIANKHSIYSRIFMHAMKLALKHETLVGPNMALTRQLWQKVKDEVCLEDKDVHEDIDLSIHAAKYGSIMFDPKLLVYASARRLKYNPSSFFVEYPIRLMKTIRLHRIPVSTKFKNQIVKFLDYLKMKV